MNLKNLRIVLLTILVTLGAFNTTYSQDINFSDISNVNVDKLSDEQIGALAARMKASGYSQKQMEAMAIARGMSPSEYAKLQDRMLKLDPSSIEGNTQIKRLRDINEIQTRRAYSSNNKVRSKQPAAEKTIAKPDTLGLFGEQIFNSKYLSFQPSLNIPTPKNYQLATGDEIIIDIWGASAQSYQLEIGPDGFVYIDNLGPVFISGKTVKEASDILKKRLTKIYSGLAGATPNTFFQLTLGNIRSISVNVIGEIKSPGTYVIPSLSTIFNALYVSGGPNENGSLRSIEVIRDNKKVAYVDIYDYLVNGNTKVNINLRDNDVIVVPPYKNRITIEGAIKRPLKYESLPNESLADIIKYAGGYSEEAYSALVKVVRNNGKQKEFYEVEEEDHGNFKLINGDHILVENVIDEFVNKISAQGAIERPGDYELKENTTVLSLIEKAGGLKDDAYTSYASIYRLNEFRQLSIVPVELSKILKDSTLDIKLKKDDILKIASIFDIEDDFTVSIEGEVKNPGEYLYQENLTIQELIIRAGGMLESSSLARVEVARRIKDKVTETPKPEIAKVFQFSVNPDLSVKETNETFILEPYDVVFIRKSPGYEPQHYVKINGEIVFNGKYAILNKEERISDVLARAGGLTTEAYVPGARLTRVIKFDKERMRSLKAIESQSLDSINLEALVTENPRNEKEVIGINLQKILDTPHSKEDLILQHGDEITIPKQLQTVRSSGALLYPSTSRYRKGKSARKYIASAGGFAQNAKKSKVYVIYANGSVDRTHSFLGIHDFPKIEPGSEIVVPEKPYKIRLGMQQAMGMATLLSSFLTVATLIKSF